MEKYLTIITTVLVITQVIRLIQNAIQLHRLSKNKKNKANDNEQILRVYSKLESYLDSIEKERK